MGDIDQMSTNTSSYTICSAPNVYIVVYILIETRIAPLSLIVNKTSYLKIYNRIRANYHKKY